MRARTMPAFVVAALLTACARQPDLDTCRFEVEGRASPMALRGSVSCNAEFDGAYVEVAVFRQGKEVECARGCGGVDFSPRKSTFAGEISVKVTDAGSIRRDGGTVDCHYVTVETPFGEGSTPIPKEEFDFAHGITCGYFPVSKLQGGRFPLLYYIEATNKHMIEFVDAVTLHELVALTQSGRFLLISLTPRLDQIEH